MGLVLLLFELPHLRAPRESVCVLGRREGGKVGPGLRLGPFLK